jgi:hypothetical protein
VAVGLLLLARGLIAYRQAALVGDTSTSPISSIAAGEVRVSGLVEAAGITLLSLLQSTPCVYYRSTVGGRGEAASDDAVTEERAIGFRIRDTSGDLRVFPRGARFDAAVRFRGDSSFTGDDPPGLVLRTGGETAAVAADDAAAARQALLTVHDPQRDGRPWTISGAAGSGGRHYSEWRIEPGDTVTIVGLALPFSDLDDPAGADLAAGADRVIDDPVVAEDLAAAQASGSLADDPAKAWGNAAIPGFGVGRPVRAPVLDPAADPMVMGGATDAAQAERTFAIPLGSLVLASTPEVPLLIAYGSPGAIEDRGRTAFLVGLVGAILAIASAMVVAITIDGGFGR